MDENYSYLNEKNRIYLIAVEKFEAFFDRHGKDGLVKDIFAFILFEIKVEIWEITGQAFFL